VQRAIRDILTDKALSAQGKAERLLDTADQLGLTRQPAPDPLPPIADDDIHLICWTAILPAAVRNHPDGMPGTRGSRGKQLDCTCPQVKDILKHGEAVTLKGGSDGLGDPADSRGLVVP
jgi:hypothetical protein